MHQQTLHSILPEIKIHNTKIFNSNFEVNLLRKFFTILTLINSTLSVFSRLVGSHMQSICKAKFLLHSPKDFLNLKHLWVWVSEKLSVYFAIAAIICLLIVIVIIIKKYIQTKKQFG